MDTSKRHREPIPKSNSKKDRKALREASRRLREANRDRCLGLDNNSCRNPRCDCSDNPALECAIVESHHILGRTRDNRYDGVEYRITLSRKCHTLYDKDRVEMMRILRWLKKTAADFRWHKALKILEERYG